MSTVPVTTAYLPSSSGVKTQVAVQPPIPGQKYGSAHAAVDSRLNAITRHMNRLMMRFFMLLSSLP